MNQFNRFAIAAAVAAAMSLVSLSAQQNAQPQNAPTPRNCAPGINFELAPYHVEGRTLRLNPNAKATLTEDLPCEERDSQHMVTHERG